MKKRGPLLAAFCIPLLITLIICVNREIYPFGDQCMLHIDMYHQYCPFFTELMEKLKTGGSPFYSWNIGLGADFVSLYAYYLASPLNWLLILWPRGYVIEFMTALSILKIALSGLTSGRAFSCVAGCRKCGGSHTDREEDGSAASGRCGILCGGCMRRGVCAVRVYGGICLESDVDGLHGACAACDSGIRAADP